MVGVDDVGVSNEGWPRAGDDPNAGSPKPGVVFVPNPVCPNPEAGFGVSFRESDEGMSSSAWFQFENALKPGLMTVEPNADVVGVEEGWVVVAPNKLPWSFS